MSQAQSREGHREHVDGRLPRETIRSVASQVSRNALTYGAGQLLSRAAAVILLMFLARQLTIEQFGTVTILMALLAIAEIGSAAGLDRVAARDLAHNPADGWRRLPDLVGLACTIAAVFSALLLTGAWARGFTAVTTTCLLLVAATILVVAANSVIDGALQGAQRMAASASGNVIASAGWLCLAVPAVLLFGARLDLIFGAMLIAQALRLAALSLSVPSMWAQMRMLPPCALQILREAAPFAMASILGTLLLRQDMLLLGWLRSEQEAALYGAASRFLDVCLFSGMIGLVALGPVLAGLHGDPDKLRRIYLKAVSLSAVTGCGAALVVYVFAETLLTLVFSATYAGAAPLLRVLAGALAAYVIHIPAMAVLLYARSTRELLIVSAASTSLSLLLNLALIPQLGAQGAAIAATVAITAGAGLAAAFVLRMSQSPAARATRMGPIQPGVDP